MARKIVLSETAVAFRAGDGQEIIYLTDIPVSDGEVLYSPDGQTYYELASRRFSGTSVEHDLSFEDPHRGRQGRWHRAGDELVLDNVTFAKVATPREITLEPLPPTRKPEDLFRTRDGRYIYVSAATYNYSSESFRLFIGDGTVMRNVPVTGVTRYRDGGTSLATAEGTLFSRRSFNRGAKPAWNHEEIELLDPSQFTISESTTGVTIDPR